ncbi:MAG TPA: MBL fold metallo-hydrolase [Vicinamibacterales bacterium]|nr:MBL fold metallo-hydrolase [Vicinamibacterales bacterium]
MAVSLSRRDVLKGALGVFATWTSSRVLCAQQAFGGVRRLTDQMTVVDGGGSNVLAFFTGEGVVLVDGGAPKSFDTIMASLGANAKVNTLFNTHHHVDQTGNNEMFSTGAQGTPLRRSGRTAIISHKRTLEWMSADHWIQADDRYEKARPKGARPTETFLTTDSLKTGGEQIDFGYLPLAHTNGDIYVHFRNANVLAVGDVASPLRDPALDYVTGAWIGGRVDAMDSLLTLANEQTRIVPAYGPVLSKAEFKAERDVMEEVRKRLFDQVREGDSPKNMLERGVLKGLARTWNDPYKFLYDAAKGLWAHHDKLGPNVV